MSATPRSLEDARAKQALLAQYVAECERIESFRAKYGDNQACVLGEDLADWVITVGERLEVFERRRDRLENALKNVGIRLYAEVTETLPSIAKALAEQGENS